MPLPETEATEQVGAQGPFQDMMAAPAPAKPIEAPHPGQVHTIGHQLPEAQLTEPIQAEAPVAINLQLDRRPEVVGTEALQVREVRAASEARGDLLVDLLAVVEVVAEEDNSKQLFNKLIS